MGENQRSQVELLYRDLKVMLDEVDRLRVENERLREDNNRLKSKADLYKYFLDKRSEDCKRLRKINQKLYSELLSKSMV